MAMSSLLAKSFQLSSLATALVLAGCGGGGGGNDTLAPPTSPSVGGGTGTTTDTTAAAIIAKVKSIYITSTASNFTATPGTEVPIIIQALDANNLPVAGAPVNVVLPDPNSTGISSDAKSFTTDASGQVTINLKVASNLTDGQKQALLNGITVKASVGSASNTVTLKGVGTSVVQSGVNNIYLSSDINAVEANTSFTMTAQVLDAYNGGLANTPVTFTIPDPNQTGISLSSKATVTTDDKGEATVTFKVGSLSDAQKTALANGITVTAAAGNKTSSILLKGANTATTVNKTDKYNVFVSTSKPELRSGSDSADLTVQVTDKQGGIAPDGTIVVISIADAAKYGLSLDQASTLTTKTGKVTVKLLQSNIGILSQLDHTANLEVKAYDATSTIASTSVSMKVSGAVVKKLVASKYLVNANDTVTLTGELVDGTDIALASSSTVTLLNNGINTGLTTSLNSGKFSFDVPIGQLAPNSNGQYNLSVQVAGNGVTQTFSDNVSIKGATTNPNLATLSYTNNGQVSTGTDVPAGSGKRTVTIQLPTTYQAGSPVYVSATKALINGQSGRQQVTVQGNSATFEIQSPVTGGDKLIVEYSVNNNGVVIPQKVEDTIAFVSIAPTKISLQSEKTVVPVSGSSNVVVKVLDANDAPVKNAIVSFTTMQDASGGQLNSATAITDENGVATVIYSAGNNPAPEVKISATLNKIIINGAETALSTPLNTTTKLTVQTMSSYINLGFSDKLISSTDNVYYFRNGSLFVTNSVGQPAANQTVSISIIPTSYYAGEYKVVDTYSSSNVSGVLAWLQVHTSSRNTQIGTPYYQRVWDQTLQSSTYSLIIQNGASGALQCKAEDDNVNGFMDIGEDRNGNGQLDPANAVTILNSAGESMDGKTVTMTTDSTGKLDFKIRYPKQAANWFEANMKVSTKVDGTESIQTQGLQFPAAADDIQLSLNAPLRPNWTSPFAYGNAGVMGSNGYCIKPN